MDQSANNDGSEDNFPPEKRLEAPNSRLIDASIATIPDMGTLRECVAYENAHQNRTPILKRLERKAVEHEVGPRSRDLSFGVENAGAEVLSLGDDRRSRGLFQSLIHLVGDVRIAHLRDVRGHLVVLAVVDPLLCDLLSAFAVQYVLDGQVVRDFSAQGV